MPITKKMNLEVFLDSTSIAVTGLNQSTEFIGPSAVTVSFIFPYPVAMLEAKLIFVCVNHCGCFNNKQP